jgi:hypothetical protein
VSNKFFYGNLILAPTTIWTATSLIAQFIGNGTQIFDSAGIATGLPIQVGTGNSTGTLQLANAINLTANSNVNVLSGTFNSNSRTVITGAVLTTGPGTKTLNIANSTLTVSNANIAWQADAANTTVTASNSVIVVNSSTTANRIFVGGGKTYGTVTTAGSAVANTIFTGNNTFDNLNSTKTVAQRVLFQANTISTFNNWSLTGTATAPITISSNTAAQHRLVKSGGGTVNVSYANISFSNASPNNTWYSLLDNFNTNSGNNTGWLFTAPTASSGNFFLMF